MPNNSSACDSQNILVNRYVGRLNEPMKTRVQFYIDKLNSRKCAGEVLTQDDVDRSMGRALRDMLDDKSIAFDRSELTAAHEAVQAGKVIGLKDIVDALPG
jgi:hypothetical protein